jgi:acetyl-CoA carboxylase biotin carboxylase subunit
MGLRIEKLAIANRGEVAVRIIKACRELGIETVLLHSEADAGSMASRLADEAFCIGGAPSSESYLNIEANIRGAIASGADAIHPGFGFLSENAEFAKACEKQRIIFVGPSAEAIALFGDKISAKNLVESIGGPLIPGYVGEDQSLATLTAVADKIGYPIIVKAAAGGGGRGLKVVRSKDEMKTALESAKSEGLNAFGSAKVFLEKYLDKAKHIEVQIFADASGNVRHLSVRDCSVQRRHQKIIEEATAPKLRGKILDDILATAVKVARAGKYKGAGTVEFLVQEDQFYFMEMNTRLQVEHTVTELVMGVDLVKAQITTAMDQPLLWPEELEPHGHAIECRLYAEDPFKGGIPSTGRISFAQFPQGPFRRFDVGVESGDEVTPFYDAMIGKLIVWDESRIRAIQKMQAVLNETIIFGVHTNIPLLKLILSHPEFIEGTMTTRFFETHFSKPLPSPGLAKSEIDLAEEIFRKVGGERKETSQTQSPFFHAWKEEGK